MSNHWPPKLLTIVDRNAMLSPQPGLPRRQMPYTPAFFERDPLQLDVGMGLLELRRELLHLDHVAVVDGRDHEVGGGCGRTGESQAASDGQGCLDLHRVSPVRVWGSVLRCGQTRAT